MINDKLRKMTSSDITRLLDISHRQEYLFNQMQKNGIGYDCNYTPEQKEYLDLQMELIHSNIDCYLSLADYNNNQYMPLRVKAMRNYKG